jgi:hypothetical protein
MRMTVEATPVRMAVHASMKSPPIVASVRMVVLATDAREVCSMTSMCCPCHSFHPQTACNRQKDVNFILDLSGSVDSDFELSIEFIRQTVYGLQFQYVMIYVLMMLTNLLQTWNHSRGRHNVLGQRPSGVLSRLLQ